MSILSFLFGNKDKRVLRKLGSVVNSINDLEQNFDSFTDEELKNTTSKLKERLSEGSSLEELMPEAFAAVRESSKRFLGLRHYDCQLIGGAILNEGMIAEMATGEGKTLVATLPCYLNALSGKSVIVVTANEYLAKRDANWMAPIFEGLGMNVGYVTPELNPLEKKENYAKDVVYATNNELGFDYLRDNMVLREEDRLQRDPYFVVVDEVDSILIDEARTPLIISGVAEDNGPLYRKLKPVVKSLTEEEFDFEKEEVEKAGDFTIDLQSRSIEITETGHEKIENYLKQNNLLEDSVSLYASENLKLLNMVQALIRAETLFEKNTDYIVQNGKVILIDTNSGRAMPGRRLSDGVHQALELKENLDIQVESQTLASTTFQNFFRMFEKLSGMTGTAKTEAREFDEIYSLEAISIPTNLPMVREDKNDKIYLTEDEKNDAIIDEIKTYHEKGNPILVGTISVENSEVLSKKLDSLSIPHRVLNAKQNQQEAEIISQAGKEKAVTIATNMAGRGTDIVLGGFPESETARKEIVELGGLHVIGTERHESRRIDNQLRGRSGRQGDPGSSQFFLSLDDGLLKIFAPDRMKALMQSFGGMKKGESIEHKMLTNSIERAQRRVEGRNFDIRKRILEFDDVLNEQRQVIYKQRKEILEDKDLDDLISNMRADVLSSTFELHIPEYEIENNWKVDELTNILESEFNLQFNLKAELENAESNTQEVLNKLLDFADETYLEKRNKFPNVYSQLENQIILQVIDQSWKNHINQLDSLRQNIGFRSYAGKDPRLEYKREAFEMFEQLLETIKKESTRFLCRVEVKPEDEQEIEKMKSREVLEKTKTVHENSPSAFMDNSGSNQQASNNDQPVEGNRRLRRLQAKANRKKKKR
jgi:preprotein translocase subunit SecA